MGLQLNPIIGRGPKQNESAMDEGINYVNRSKN
jgi:hypothetical protein